MQNTNVMPGLMPNTPNNTYNPQNPTNRPNTNFQQRQQQPRQFNMNQSGANSFQRGPARTSLIPTCMACRKPGHIHTQCRTHIITKRTEQLPPNPIRNNMTCFLCAELGHGMYSCPKFMIINKESQNRNQNS